MPSRNNSPNRSEAFGRLLSGAINSIATYEGRTAPVVEEELGQLLSLSGKTIQRYKTGHLPPEHETVKVLAEVAVRRGFLDREWLQRFLYAARYPFADKLLDQLKPSSPERVHPPRVYENLPAPTYSQFVMREQAFAEVVDGLQQRSAVVLIVGLGGNGKTSLAREVAARCLQDDGDVPRFDAVVWVSDKVRRGTTNLSNVLDEIARTLDYPGFTQFEHEEKRREVEQLLRRQRVLIIIDNFETITDGALLTWLLRLPEPSKALITSREKHRGLWSSWLAELRGMSEVEAQTLIHQRLRMLQLDKLVTNPVEFEPLVVVTGGNPKAIEIALGLVKHERRPIQQVVDDLHAGRGELFDDLFMRVWGLLDEAARRVLLVMTFFPASASSAALSMTADVQGFAFHRAIERLTDLALLDVQQEDLNSPPRYTLHPLVQAFAGAKLTEQPEFEEKARARWSTYFLGFVTLHIVREKPRERYWNALASAGLGKIDPEWTNIRYVLDWADQREHEELLIELMIHLAHYMDRRGLYTDRIYYARRAADSADKLGQRSSAALLRDEALLRIDALGYTLIEEGRFEEAEQEIYIGLDRVQMLDPESPDALDLRMLAQAFLERSYLHRDDVARALAWSRQPLPTGCRTVIQHRVIMARGEIALAICDYTSATALFKEAIHLEEEYGGEEAVRDELSQLLGFAYLGLGDLEMARAAFNEVLALKERAGTLETIWGKYGLACVAKAEGDHYDAYRLAHEALDALTRLKIRHLLHQRIPVFLKSLEVNAADFAATT